MFKIVAEPTFTHTVTANVPVDGGFEEQSFKATFRVIEPEEVDKFALGTSEGSTAFLKRVVAGLDDIADAEGKAIQFNDAVLASVLKLQWARSALARAYFAGVSGAKSGN